MCGIAGILGLTGAPVRRSDLERMCDLIEHRGPDDFGLHVEGSVGLGSRRLKIIDLSSNGHMPMSNEDGTVWIAYNGEIYNFAALRSQLQSKGHVFRSATDTEVVVHAWEEWGVDCLQRFNGIFAFALWDARTRRLLLVRDPLGVKPLYYHRAGDRLAFASEIKALCALSDLPRRLNEAVLPEYLSFRYVAGAQTLLRDVFSLLPGHYLLAEGGTLTEGTFWDISAEWTSPASDEAAVLSTISGHIARSVRMQLVSDVPLGIQLSGGIDSGLIASFAAESRDQLGSYTISLEDPSLDESRLAGEVASRYSTDPHVFTLKDTTCAELLPRLVWHNDEPLNHPNSFGIYELSRNAKKHVTVLVSGEGGDEVFGGYWHYRRALTASSLAPLSFAARGLLAAPPLFALFPRRVRGALYQTARARNEEDLFLYATAFCAPERIRNVFHAGSGDGCSYRREQLGRFAGLPPSQRMMFLDMKTYLVSVLNRQDKMSMAASIETRVPLLDLELVRFALPLPAELKQLGGESKHLLKSIGASRLPHEILYQTKKGFGLPTGKWLSDPNLLGRYVAWLTDSKATLPSYLDPAGIRQAIAEHGTRRDESGEGLLWSLVNLEVWCRTFLASSVTAPG
jgi:asparagine synthase (glutamine-hydrolysing)